MSNRRTGKVASLPTPIREQVNLRIRDGVTYPVIIKWLDNEGFPGMEDQNMTNWFQGGYAEWLADQKMIETASARAKASLDLIRELKKDGEVHITEANELILASQVNEQLRRFDSSKLTAMLADKPKEFFNLAMTVTAQSSERTKREKLEFELRKYQDAVAKARTELQKLKDPKQSLTDEDRKAIVDKVDEVLGIK